jgi:serine/threonine protein kinase
LLHFFSVMARLHKNAACRKLVVFPICVREYNDDPEFSCIVFPRLGPEYQIGLPDTHEDRLEFFEKLKSAVRTFHDAGVAHLDFYLSNIMWKKDGLGIHIKVIDWDSAHFLHERLYDSARQRLEKICRAEVFKKVVSKHRVDLTDRKAEMRYHDISLVVAFEAYIDDPSLQLRSKQGLDAACFAILGQYAADPSK